MALAPIFIAFLALFAHQGLFVWFAVRPEWAGRESAEREAAVS